jgi:methylthioxylose transferase
MAEIAEHVTTTIERVRETNTAPPATRRRVAVVAGVTALVAIAFIWGARLTSRVDLGLDLAPLYATWMPRWGPGLVLAAIVAAVVVRFDRDLAPHVSFPALLVACAIGAAAWGISLALVDGAQGIVQGLDSRHHGYLVVLDRLPGASEFVRTFTDRIAGYPTHVRGHPPGVMVALLWLDRAGLASPRAVAALLVAAGASIPVAALLIARRVGGEHAARRAAPFLVLAPAAVWLVSNLDALYAAVGAWSVLLLVRAAERDMRGDVCALGGGLLLGTALFLSYGLVLLALVPGAVLVSARRWRAVALAVIGVACVVALFAAFGFWWPDGLSATRAEYLKGIASVRPYGYFVIANLVSFGIAVGIGAVAGIGCVRDRRVWLLAGAALLAVAIADVSGMSKGEVERIWLPFWPFVALLAAQIPGGRERRWWLAAQASTAIAMVGLLFIP